MLHFILENFWPPNKDDQAPPLIVTQLSIVPNLCLYLLFDVLTSNLAIINHILRRRM